MSEKDLVILEIYNRYSRGEITIEQRDLLFDKCDEVFNEMGLFKKKTNPYAQAFKDDNDKFLQDQLRQRQEAMSKLSSLNDTLKTQNSKTATNYSISKCEIELKNLESEIEICKEKMKNTKSSAEKKELVDKFKQLSLKHKEKKAEYKKLKK